MTNENVEFTGQSGTVYTMNFGTNAACRVEEATTRSYDEVMYELKSTRPRVTTVRQWVKAALVTPGADSVTLDQVGDLIDDLGGWTFVLAGLDSKSPAALSASQAIKEALAMLAAAKPSEPSEPSAVVVEDAPVDTVTH